MQILNFLPTSGEYTHAHTTHAPIELSDSERTPVGNCDNVIYAGFCIFHYNLNLMYSLLQKLSLMMHPGPLVAINRP